jgi:drug/metabolite transporter (DMT)-like permease
MTIAMAALSSRFWYTALLLVVLALTNASVLAFSAPTRTIHGSAALQNRHKFASADSNNKQNTCCRRQSTIGGVICHYANDNDNDSTINDDNSERRTGLLVLLTVPFAWGSFEPAVRLLYTMDPPVPGFVFSTAYYVVAATTLLTLAVVNANKNNKTSAADAVVKGMELRKDTLDWPIRGGVELGVYLFLGNALQVVGLKTVSADRAAFLLQLTTVFVPLVQSVVAKVNVSARTWVGCLVALLGVGVMGLEGNEDAIASSLLSENSQPAVTNLLSGFALTTGDSYVVAAALAYTFHCIRLERFAQTTSAIQLAACKATTEALLSGFAALIFVWASQSLIAGDVLVSLAQPGTEIITYFNTLASGTADGSISSSTWIPAVLVTLWTGWVVCAYTISAQTYGQKRVKPVTANLIYTIQPLCTSLYAFVLLNESLGAAGYLGGALIGASVLLVSTEPGES